MSNDGLSGDQQRWSLAKSSQSVSAFRWLILGLVLASCTLLSDTSGHSVTNRERCGPGSEFTCISLEVPLNHFDESDPSTIEVTFALRPASVDPEGVLVTAVGGPGASGVLAADEQLSVLDSSITDRFDLVFFDQRGVGMLDSPICPETDQAASADEEAATWEAAAEATGQYIIDCIEESTHSEEIIHLGTDQAIRDLELFRRAMGYEKLTLYGRSYGTRLVQTYATEYPEAVERIVIDAPIDLTQDALRSISERTEAAQTVLAWVLAECESDPQCSADMGMPAYDAYTLLFDQLDQSPATVDYPVEPNSSEEIPLTAEDLHDIATQASYSESMRMAFLRALAAAIRDEDLTPMMWFLAGGGGFGDDTDASVMLNLAINCPDISIPGDDIATETVHVIEARLTDWANEQEYQFPISCLYWPEIDHKRSPSQPFQGTGIPTLVVAAELDPATPYSSAIAIYKHLDEGHLLTVQGGFHVMFGRGNRCVDEAVTEFIVDETPPPTRCEAEIMTPYVPLLPDRPGEKSAVEVLPILDEELFNWPPLTGIDVSQETEISCPRGGSVVFRSTEVGAEFELQACWLNDVVHVTGEGSWDFLDEVSRYQVSFDHGCVYDYTRSWNDGSETIDPACSRGECQCGHHDHFHGGGDSQGQK